MPIGREWRSLTADPYGMWAYAWPRPSLDLSAGLQVSTARRLLATTFVACEDLPEIVPEEDNVYEALLI
jgi:hypothetical protein